MDAIAAEQWAEVCNALVPEARQELIELAMVTDPEARTCTAAAALEMFPELGQVPIVDVTLEGDVVRVVVGDAQYSDSGNDSFRMEQIDHEWRVLNL